MWYWSKSEKKNSCCLLLVAARVSIFKLSEHDTFSGIVLRSKLIWMYVAFLRPIITYDCYYQDSSYGSTLGLALGGSQYIQYIPSFITIELILMADSLFASWST